jgi:hypothetical protein
VPNEDDAGPLGPSDWNMLHGAWRKFDTATVLSVWHLHAGGIQLPDQINAILGTKIHAAAVKSMIAAAERLVRGPLALKNPIRCRGCGAAILEMPCIQCRLQPGKGLIYRLVTAGQSKS